MPLHLRYAQAFSKSCYSTSSTAKLLQAITLDMVRQSNQFNRRGRERREHEREARIIFQRNNTRSIIVRDSLQSYAQDTRTEYILHLIATVTQCRSYSFADHRLVTSRLINDRLDDLTLYQNISDFIRAWIDRGRRYLVSRPNIMFYGRMQFCLVLAEMWIREDHHSFELRVMLEFMLTFRRMRSQQRFN